jgi:hypothetical protein
MGNVIVESYRNLRNWPEIKPILEVFANAFEINLKIFYPRDVEKVREPEKNIYQIYFCSAPSVGIYTSNWALSKSYPKIYNIPVNATGIYPSKAAIPIKDGENIIAEYINQSLFILFDLPNPCENAGIIIERLLSDFATICLIRPARRGKAKKDLQDKFELFKNNLSRLLFKNPVIIIEQAIERLKKTSKILSRKLISISLETAALEKLSRTIENDPNLYQKTIKIPHVKRMNVGKKGNNIVLSVFTDDILIEYEEHFYNIGRFEIRLIFGEDYEIICNNLTKKRDDYDHPHVVKGEPCLGNISSLIPKLIAKYDIPAVIWALVTFLESYNDSNAYCDIDNWPISKKGIR